MRILHMILSLTGGGAERQLAYLAPALSGRGHDVHVGFIFPGPSPEQFGEGCTLHPLPAWARRTPLLLIESLSLVRRLRPDVIQTWLVHMDIVGGATARLLRLPWVIGERSAALSYPPTRMNRVRVAISRR